MPARILGSIITAAACPVGHVSNAELLALLGVFGSIFSLVQAGILEHSALRDAPWNWQVCLGVPCGCYGMTDVA
jgi:Solute carrier family 35